MVSNIITSLIQIINSSYNYVTTIIFNIKSSS